MLLTSCAHTYAFLNIDKKDTLTYNYFHYSIPEHYVLAMEIFYLGVISVTLGFNFGLNFRPIVPKLQFSLPSSANYFVFGIIVTFLIFFSSFISLPGALQKIFLLLPLFYIFIVVRKSFIEDIKILRVYGLVVMSLITFQTILFSYLRSAIIMPIVVYLFATLTTKRTIRSFLTVDVILLFCLMLYLNSYFSVFGENRSGISTGYARIGQLYELNKNKNSNKPNEEGPARQDIFARASLINQLSQIGRLVKEDGFYDGKTLLYLTFAFIPRFVWPEKPIIQQGGWFALRIGQAIQNEYGKYNNSVNMTIYGEFYLNFGFVGLIICGFLFGMFICQFWLVSDFNGNHNNLLGAGFGLTLILAGFFQLGADLQFIVTQIAVYLMLLAISLILKKSNG